MVESVQKIISKNLVGKKTIKQNYKQCNHIRRRAECYLVTDVKTAKYPFTLQPFKFSFDI